MPEQHPEAIKACREGRSAGKPRKDGSSCVKCVAFHIRFLLLPLILAVLSTCEAYQLTNGSVAGLNPWNSTFRHQVDEGRVHIPLSRISSETYDGVLGVTLSQNGCSSSTLEAGFRIRRGLSAHRGDLSTDATDTENEDIAEDSELEIERFIEACGGWESDEENAVDIYDEFENTADSDAGSYDEFVDGSSDENPEVTDETSQDAVISSIARPQYGFDGELKADRPNEAGTVASNRTVQDQELSYTTPPDEEDASDEREPVPFRIITTGDKVKNLLSQRLYVKKLFRRIPQIGDTTSVLVRSKAHVKGKVGSRSDLAMGNSNKIKTVDTPEEPVYDGKPLYAGVYNGLTPQKHTKKRVLREIKVKVDWYAHSITHQIKNVTTFYEQLLRYIHPFQYQMLMTAIYELHHTREIKLPFDHLMDALKTLKTSIVTRANNFNSKIGSIKKCREAFALAKAFILQLDESYKEAEPYINIYRKFATHFRKLPIINNAKPVVAIVGYVNVGKSTLFQKLCNQPIPTVSSIDVGEELPNPLGLISDVLGLKWQENSSPPVKVSQKEVKIADYNFTTKSLNLANVQYKVDNFIDEAQLLDTPGLLWRDKPKTNPYEKLTYATLKDLPSGVIYCFDVSDKKKLDSQIKLYRTLEARFPHRPWINVISKGHDAQLLKDEGIDVVPEDQVLERLYSMFNNLDGLLRMQRDVPTATTEP
ncbi:GTP-binding protein [Babesia ovata]|uniref:GTP-binding protein n=1 Tax=Babesia ovata TaxID=189622 RepID=A0A2H6KAC2_9APIC|nr:GTP-binding protein [Babesia ovata]GBE59933.1 GTP-binding protein [Babesia ovata]